MVIVENGVERKLEDFELEALAAAHKAKVEAEVAEQWGPQEAMQAIIRASINTLNIPIEDAVHMVSMYPWWEAGASYTAGTRVQYGQNSWDAVLYECLQAHTAQEGWEPGSAPSLWAKILPGQSGTDIGEWVQPDSTNPYMKGDRVTFNGALYYSTIDYNVWAPNVYGWVEVDE